jgi:predicted transcriptional regulator
MLLWTGFSSLVELIGREEVLSLGQLVDRSGFARQIVHNHLRHLVEAGVVLKEVVKHGRGDPS